MKHVRKVFVLLVLVCGCISTSGGEARAQAPRTPTGTWKVYAITINGTSLSKEQGIGPFAVGGVWNLRGDGTGTLAGWPVRWSYDGGAREVTIREKTILGLWYAHLCTANVRWQDGRMRLNFTLWFRNYEVVLSPDN